MLPSNPSQQRNNKEKTASFQFLMKTPNTGDILHQIGSNQPIGSGVNPIEKALKQWSFPNYTRIQEDKAALSHGARGSHLTKQRDYAGGGWRNQGA